MICFKGAPFDALIDMSANYSMLDAELCRYLHLDVIPFQYDIPLCMGIEGACMTKSILAILGWVELEIGIPSLGLAIVRLWVADTQSCKGTPFILGSSQIKKIFSQVKIEEVDNCPQPWKAMHYRYVYGDHWSDDSEDLFDSDAYDTEEEDSFDLLCRFESSQLTPSSSHSSLDSWLQNIEYPAPPESENDDVVEEKVLKGILDSKSESDVNGNPTPAAKVDLPLPLKAEEPQHSGGGKTSVFTNLAVKSEGQAAEAEFPPCNLEVPAPPVDFKVELPSHPLVSCRITPTGEATLSLQWVKK